MVVEVGHDDVAEGVGGGVVGARQLVQLRTPAPELGHQAAAGLQQGSGVTCPMLPAELAMNPREVSRFT